MARAGFRTCSPPVREREGASRARPGAGAFYFAFESKFRAMRINSKKGQWLSGRFDGRVLSRTGIERVLGSVADPLTVAGAAQAWFTCFPFNSVAWPWSTCQAERQPSGRWLASGADCGTGESAARRLQRTMPRLALARKPSMRRASAAISASPLADCAWMACRAASSGRPWR